MLPAISSLSISSSSAIFCPPSLGKLSEGGKKVSYPSTTGTLPWGLFQMLQPSWDQPMTKMDKEFKVISDRYIKEILQLEEDCLELFQIFKGERSYDDSQSERIKKIFSSFTGMGCEVIVDTVDMQLEVQKKYVDSVGMDMKAYWTVFRDLFDKSKVTFERSHLGTLSGYFIQFDIALRSSLKRSEWHPKDSFEKFSSILKSEGPLLVSGRLGPVVENRQEPVAKIQSREVYEPHLEYSKVDLRYYILLVGAETKDSKDYVYYITSDDPSHPETPELQRVFRIPYDELTVPSKLVNNVGQGIDRHAFFPRDKVFGYALCRNNQVASLDKEEKKSVDFK